LDLARDGGLGDQNELRRSKHSFIANHQTISARATLGGG